MFGAARKKKPRPVRKAADSSDDDDGNEKETSAKLIEQAKRNKQKKRKKKPPPKTLSLSFDPGDGEDAEEDDTPLHSKSSGQKKKKQKKKSKSKKNSGLGYGGALQMSESDASDEDGIDVAQQQSSSYGAEALRQLHSEQKRTLTEKKVNGNDVSPNEKPRESESEKKRGSVEADYISLSGNNSSTVLTGEEALALADQDDDENDVNEFDHGLSERAPQPEKGPSESEGVEPEEEVVEGQRQWEDTMARRAGVLPSDSADQSSHGQRRRRPERSDDDVSSLREIKSSLQPTISNLENMYSDIETSASRHQSTQSATRDELSKQQQDLEHHGEALEYYQRYCIHVQYGSVSSPPAHPQPLSTPKSPPGLSDLVGRPARARRYGENC